MLIFLISCLFQLACAESVEPLLDAANGNNTILRETIISAFVSSPRSRGTLDILWSCIVTIVACVYTAIHVHVPAPGKSRWKRLRHKLGWTIMALLAPEMILHTALCQFREARSMVRILNELRAQNGTVLQDNQDAPQAPRFSMTYGFFVVMGGMIINTKGLHNVHSQITLTTFGLEILARNGHFIETPDEEIMDRSKANVLAKILICIQVLWMLIQCTTRGISGLPLSLLEIHTLVHVVCALCIYSLWWKKPLDIELPLLIDDSKFRDITALMLMGSKYCNTAYEIDRSVNTSSELAELWHNLKPRQPEEASSSLEVQNTTVSGETIDSLAGKTSALDHIFLGRRLKKKYIRAKDFNDIDDLRWNLSAQILVQQGWRDFLTLTEAGLKATPYNDLGRSAARYCEDITITEEAENFLWGKFEIPILSRLVLIGLPCVYGALHLLAWNLEFPTYTERLLWRVSAFWVMAAVPSSAISSRFLHNHPDGKTNSRLSLLSSCIMWFRVSVWIIWYICRMYLVIESFISLRRVPLGVFATPSWLQSIPHT